MNNIFAIKPYTLKTKTILRSTPTIKKLDEITSVKNEIKAIVSSADKETKNIITGLAIAASSFLTKCTMLTDNHDEAKKTANDFFQDFGIDININNSSNNDEIKNNTLEENEIDYKILFTQNPDRNKYLAITSKYFPDLNDKYEQLLITSLKEPDNDDNKFILDTLENIFNVLTKDGIKYKRGYFEALNKNYSNCLKGVCTNFISTISNGESPMQYLVLLNNEKITEDEINKWTNFNNLSCKEFMITRDVLNDQQLTRLNNLKKQNNNFIIKELRQSEYENPEQQAFIFKLDFYGNMPVAEKLKTISQVHEALHGTIKLQEPKFHSQEYILKDIQSEMLDSLVKDKRLDAVYSFVKYINPDALKKYNLTTKEIKFLEKDNKTHKEIKKICTRQIMNLDPNNKNLQTLFNVLNNNEIFQNTITSRHAKMRFITRIVLKDNPSTDLEKDTKSKITTLTDALEEELDKCNFFCYIKSQRNAPQFYIRNSNLGDYIKITLNHEGSIHTIFEDFNKELKSKEKESGDSDTL